MKAKILFLSLMLGFASIVSPTFATTEAVVTSEPVATSEPEMKLYDTKADFENSSEAATCEAATDGCNTYIVQDGKVTAGTLKFCADADEAWSCTKQKEHMTVCTREYAPVCGKDGITYSNACMAKAANAEVASQGACDRLSTNDRNLYNHVRSEVDSNYVALVDRAIAQHGEYLKRKRWSREKMLQSNQATIDRIDGIINSIVMSNPQDVALPPSENDRYLKLTLIKFALMDLDL